MKPDRIARSIDRRQALLALGGIGGSLLFAGACSTSDTSSSPASTSAPGSVPGPTGPGTSADLPAGCTLTPELMEGPFYLDLDLVREDITEGRPGVPLELRFRVIDAARCAPQAGAAVDVWHCDAGGVYSGFTAVGNGTGGGGFGGGAGGGGRGDGTTFLRGIQLTGDDGVASIRTIFPGWYEGRTVHVHVKVHLGGEATGGTGEGGHTRFTGQVFFDEALSARFETLEPYRSNTARRTTNAADGIYGGVGPVGIVRTTLVDDADLARGLVATIDLVVDAAAVTTTP